MHVCHDALHMRDASPRDCVTAQTVRAMARGACGLSCHATARRRVAHITAALRACELQLRSVAAACATRCRANARWRK
eukprot:11195771-Lingulodinium_polyedra.AAC.1